MKLPAPLKFQISNFKFKIFFYFLFSIFYFLFSTAPVAAQTNSATLKQINPYNPYLNPNTNPDVPKNLHTWTQNVMIEVMSAMVCQITGIDPTNPKKSQCLGVDPKTGNIGFVEGGGGTIGAMGKMIAMLYTPPLHTADYFRYLADNFGIAKQAHAATGFEGLLPIQSLWIAFRNIVYLFMVIVFVIIGLAIMLRVRIDPRTVMTIQNQIPRIIIGILFVTFSFAIAGFLIDLMYATIFLSYEVISGGVPSVDFSGLNPLHFQDPDATNPDTSATPFTLVEKVKSGGIVGVAAAGAIATYYVVFDVFNSAIVSFLEMLLPFDTITSVLGTIKGVVEDIFTLGGSIPGTIELIGKIPIVGNVISGILSKVLGVDLAESISGLVGFLVAILAFLIIGIALLYSLIRLWFVLIIAYVLILIDVVLAPFLIIAGLLPGVPLGFVGWLKSIISNLAAYPATFIMFLLAKAFIDGFGAKPSETDFIPPFIGAIPGTDMLGNIIAIGIIFMTPNVVNMVRAALKAPTPSGGPIVAALDVATATPGEILKTGALLGGTLYGLSHLPKIGNLPGLRNLRNIRGAPPQTP